MGVLISIGASASLAGALRWKQAQIVTARRYKTGAAGRKVKLARILT
jgi:hypothetical protein